MMTGTKFHGEIYLGHRVQYRADVSWQSRLETRSSILEAIENRVSRFEARVSSFEFRDARRIFRGSRYRISRKRLIFLTSNSRREQRQFSRSFCSSHSSKSAAVSVRYMWSVSARSSIRESDCCCETCLKFSYPTPEKANFWSNEQNQATRLRLFRAAVSISQAENVTRSLLKCPRMNVREVSHQNFENIIYHS